ncbi:LPXTG cell wall anchor domain-containing protein [uncultured Vagococcus sp.]|nr:LPXTG cell wall anchor domain-containing protein [uncultured Vagococcus sp.]
MKRGDLLQTSEAVSTSTGVIGAVLTFLSGATLYKRKKDSKRKRS